MASVKNLKRDIDNTVFEVISDCFIYTGLHPDSNAQEVSQILNDAVSLRNDLIYRINNPVKSDDPKIVRKHYQNIKADLQKEVDLLWGRLSVISKKKKK
jgi:trans-2-enoyl-CoA reductase